MQKYALYFILLQNHFTCFACRPHPSSGTHQTVTTASDTTHIICAATSLILGLATIEWDSCRIIWLVPVAVTKVLCTPDDGCGRHPKHVEWFCSTKKYSTYCCISWDNY